MAERHVLVGKLLHMLDGSKRIERQGQVSEVVGEFATIRWFSFSDGRPTSISPVRVAELLVPEFEPYSRVHLYDSHREWSRAYARQATDDWEHGVWCTEGDWEDWYDEHFDATGNDKAAK